MYCTIDDILNIISEKELVNLTCDMKCSPVQIRGDVDGDYSSATQCVPAYKSAPVPPPYIDEDRFNAISLDADSLINGYLRARYSLPLKSTPAFIKTIAVDIVAYRLYSRRSQKLPEHIVNNYNNAIKSLQDIQKGNLLLEKNDENEDVNLPTVKSGFRCSKNKNDRIFTDRMMRAFRGC